MNTLPLISFRNVCKSWNQVTVLQNFNLDITSGELVVLVGSSGCGKSTLLRMLVGLEPASSGDILVSGKTVSGVGNERGIIFQEPRLFPWLTVTENVLLGLANSPLSGSEKKRLALNMLGRVQLTDFANVFPSQLSGGMAQRVAIARGIIAHPQILMLDEPFGALDALTRHTLQQQLLELHLSTGSTTLLVTHDVEEAVALADRVIVLSPRPGRIREEVKITLPHTRHRDDIAFIDLCRHIRHLITDVL